MSHIVHVISYVERGIIVYLCNYMMRLHVNVYGNSQHCSLAVVIQYFYRIQILDLYSIFDISVEIKTQPAKLTF